MHRGVSQFVKMYDGLMLISTILESVTLLLQYLTVLQFYSITLNYSITVLLVACCTIVQEVVNSVM